jgi:hypothetical protein
MMARDNETGRFVAASASLLDVLEQETLALAGGEPLAVISSIARTKALFADRLIEAARDIGRGRPPGAADAAQLQAAMARLGRVLEHNAAVVKRKLDLVSDLMGAIELETRRASGRLVSIYDHGGADIRQQPVPVAVNALM